LQNLGGVIEHAGIELARAIRQSQMQHRLPALFLADVLIRNEERSVDGLVRLKFAYIGRLHPWRRLTRRTRASLRRGGPRNGDDLQELLMPRLGEFFLCDRFRLEFSRVLPGSILSRSSR